MCSLDPACDAAGCHPWQGQPGLSDTPRRACSSQASPGTSSPPTGLCALKPGASGLRAEAEAPNRPAGTKPPRSHRETIQSTRRFRTETTDGVRDTSSRAPAPRDALRTGRRAHQGAGVHAVLGVLAAPGLQEPRRAAVQHRKPPRAPHGPPQGAQGVLLGVRHHGRHVAAAALRGGAKR